MHPGAARYSPRASLDLVGSTGPLLHSRRDRKTHTKAGLPTRATEPREMLWAQRVPGSIGRLSCTLEWSERSAPLRTEVAQHLFSRARFCHSLVATPSGRYAF